MSLKIGMPGWAVEGKYFGVGLAYAEFVNSYGQLHILSPDMDIRTDLDLLVLPGGADVAPSRFPESEKPSYYTGPSNPLLEYFDKYKLPKYIDAGIGILSICRASQSIWQMFGGKMNQHNYWHEQSKFPKDECHNLSWTSEEYRIEYGPLMDKVNSRHHQTMIGGKHTPDELEVIAYAKEQALIFEDIV